jgi:hypothetical protein
LQTPRQYRDRSSTGRGRGQASVTHGHLQRHTRINGLAPSPQELNSSVEGNSEHAQEGFTALGSAKAKSSESCLSQPSTWGSRYANGFLHTSEKHESGSVSPQLCGPPRTEVSNYSDSGISTSRGSVPNTGVVAEEKSNSSSVVDPKR